MILVAKQYRNRGVPLEDLVNEGNIGLIRAAERFDPDRGIRFVSYAVWWIRQAILKAIQENGRLIRVPKSRVGELSRIEELRREGLMQNGSEPRLGQIAEALVFEEGELVTLLQAAQSTLSLDSPVTDMENPEPFGACLEDRSVPRPEEVLVGRLPAGASWIRLWPGSRTARPASCGTASGWPAARASRCWRSAGSTA